MHPDACTPIVSKSLRLRARLSARWLALSARRDGFAVRDARRDGLAYATRFAS